MDPIWSALQFLGTRAFDDTAKMCRELIRWDRLRRWADLTRRIDR